MRCDSLVPWNGVVLSEAHDLLCPKNASSSLGLFSFPSSSPLQVALLSSRVTRILLFQLFCHLPHGTMLSSMSFSLSPIFLSVFHSLRVFVCLSLSVSRLSFLFHCLSSLSWLPSSTSRQTASRSLSVTYIFLCSPPHLTPPTSPDRLACHFGLHRTPSPPYHSVPPCLVSHF